jgi:hypothetical protein
MALWPNVRRDIIGQFPASFSGYLAFQQVQQRTQRNLAYFANESIADTSSVPEGAFPSAVTIVPPLVDGGMSSANNATDVAFTTEGRYRCSWPVMARSP